MRQVIFPKSSRGIWKKKFLVVQKRLYFKNFPIGNFSEHIIEVSRDLDLQNIEGSPDLKQLIRAGLKMTKQTKILDQEGRQVGTWTEPNQP